MKARALFPWLATAAVAVALALPLVSQAKDIASITPSDLEDIIAKGRGKVLIVDFFATWCPPCREEIPGFVALQDKYGKQGLEIIGVSLDEGPVGVVEDFAEDLNINYALYMGGNAMARKYRIRAIPTTYVYDRAGNKVKTHIGFVPAEEFERQVAGLL